MRNDRNEENLASTTVSDMKAVAQDMLRMGKHWTQAAQDWLDQRREDVGDGIRPRRTRRRGRDFGSDYSSAGYDQVDTASPYGMHGARGYRGVGPRDYNRSDERIREDLNERLTEADDLDASDLSVQVSNGIATLTGSVEQRWMKHRAEDLVDACIGVREVRNQVQVRSGTRGSGASQGGGLHASGGVRVGSSEVSGNLHTNVGTSSGGTGGSTTPTGTGTNTHQDTSSGRT